MHLNRLDLNLLIALDALLQEKSVTRAAERVYISQPAMSGALQRLRENFNDQLLVRVGRTMELTPKAKSLIKPVREIILDIQSIMESEPVFDPATARRSFNIAMTDFVAAVFMPDAMKRLEDEAPGMQLHIKGVTVDCHKELDSGDLDLVIRVLTRDPPEPFVPQAHKYEELFTDPMVCAVWDKHPHIGDELTLEQYLAHPHLSLSLGASTPTLETLAMMQASLDIDIRATAPGFTPLLTMLPGTSLVTVVPDRLARQMASYIPIKTFPPPFEISDLNECLFWHSRNDEDAAMNWLRNLFRSVAANL